MGKKLLILGVTCQFWILPIPFLSLQYNILHPINRRFPIPFLEKMLTLVRPSIMAIFGFSCCKLSNTNFPIWMLCDFQLEKTFYRMNFDAHSYFAWKTLHIFVLVEFYEHFNSIAKLQRIYIFKQPFTKSISYIYSKYSAIKPKT